MDFWHPVRFPRSAAPGGAGLEATLAETGRLQAVRVVGLPPDPSTGTAPEAAAGRRTRTEETDPHGRASRRAGPVPGAPPAGGAPGVPQGLRATPQ